MINADVSTPDVPAELGHENAVYFTRGSNEYWIVQAAPEIWLIHRRNVAPKDFQIQLEGPDRARKIFDATGNAGPIHIGVLGFSLAKIISMYC